MCLLGAAACFSIAFFIHLPFFALRPSKFAVSIRCVSVSIILSTFSVIHNLYIVRSLGSLLVMLGSVLPPTLLFFQILTPL